MLAAAEVEAGAVGHAVEQAAHPGLAERAADTAYEDVGKRGHPGHATRAPTFVSEVLR